MALADVGRLNSKDAGEYSKERLSAPPDFDGPTAYRSCTDIIFAILLLVMWGAMTMIGVHSDANGDYRAVLYPMDYDGNICGTDFGALDMTNYSKIVYVNNFVGGVCVKECPSVNVTTDLWNGTLFDPFTLITYGGLYQTDGAVLSPDFVEIANYSTAEGVKYCDEDTCDTDPENSFFSSGINKGNGFAFYAIDTIEFAKTRCISNPSALREAKDGIKSEGVGTILDIEEVNEVKEFFRFLYSDLFEARNYIVGFGLGVSMMVGFLYSQLLRIQATLGLMIWGSILSAIFIVLGCGAYAFNSANEWAAADPQVHSDGNIQAAKICSYVLFIVGAFLILVTTFLRQQIMLAMACVRQASRAIASMGSMLLFPFVQVIGVALFMLPWLYYAVTLASTGEVTVRELEFTSAASIRTYKFDDMTRNYGWYLLFCLYWTVAFVAAMGEIIIAMTVAKWYFTKDKRSVGFFTLFGSIKETFRYHVGTAAFGSFIIAVTQIIRSMVASLQRKARELDNKIGEALLCCCQCCLWCFEKVIKFLNKNAYIQTAIFGTPFCKSAREAFSLIVRNAGKVASISYVSTVVLFVGKVFISALSTGAGYIYMDRNLGAQLHSTGGPCALIFFMAYVVGDMFLTIFDMSTSTILQCFIADEEMFDGDECYADGELRNWLDDFDEQERKLIPVRQS